MSIKKTVLAFVFSLALLSLKGQQVEFRPSLGVGNYLMTDFKEILQVSVLQDEIGLKTTHNFPPYLFYELDFIYYPHNHFGFGLTTGFYSTGGRNHYADYSGSLREDIKVLAANAGLMAAYRSTIGKNWFWQFEVASGAKYSDLSLESEFIIGEYSEDSNFDFWSLGWWVEPQLRLGRTFGKKYALSLFAGYEYNLESELKQGVNDEMEYRPKMDWSGIRAGISLSFLRNYPKGESHVLIVEINRL